MPDEQCPAGPDEELGFCLEAEVDRRSGLSRSTRYRMAMQGTFPKTVPLTPTGRRRAIPRRLFNQWLRARERGEAFPCSK